MGETATVEISLVRRLMSGDKDAFEEFVRLFRPKLFQYSYLMCGHREDAEEVAQEALVKVFENFSQLRDPARIKPWVFRIAKNACHMKRRRSVFAPARELSLEQLRPSFTGEGEGRRLEIADWSAVPEQLAQRSQLRDILKQAIAELPEMYRSVLLLRDVEELTTLETAAVLDLSEDAVKTRLHRARLAVRQQLDQYLRNSKEGT